jgi:hypothetical protein
MSSALSQATTSPPASLSPLLIAWAGPESLFDYAVGTFVAVFFDDLDGAVGAAAVNQDIFELDLVVSGPAHCGSSAPESGRRYSWA